MSLTRVSKDQYPSGKGWQLISEEDLESEEDRIDPRWEKLSEFKLDDD